jgi:hypothetical protein
MAESEHFRKQPDIFEREDLEDFGSIDESKYRDCSLGYLQEFEELVFYDRY